MNNCELFPTGLSKPNQISTSASENQPDYSFISTRHDALSRWKIAGLMAIMGVRRLQDIRLRPRIRGR